MRFTHKTKIGLAALCVSLLAAATAHAGSSKTSAARSRSSVQLASSTASRPDRIDGPDLGPGCPGGKGKRVLDCGEMVCPCQRGHNVVLARAFDPATGCCNSQSCDSVCRSHTRCPRFKCPCGVPGDLAAATDETTGECITNEKAVCARACKN